MLNNLKGPWRKLNRDKFADIHEQQRLARMHLEKVQNELHGNPRDEGLLEQEKEARGRYLELLKSSLTLIKQQSKQLWITHGDQTSKPFFAKMKQRKINNYVYSITDGNDNRREGFDEVAKIMLQFYQGLLGRKEDQRVEINLDAVRLGPQLLIEQQMKMIEPFTEREIKEAILAIPSIKSPGPDGFSSSFFKAS